MNHTEKRAVKQAIKKIMVEERDKSWPDFLDIVAARVLDVPGLRIEDPDQTAPERLARVPYGTADTTQASTSRLVYFPASAEDWKAAGFVKCLPSGGERSTGNWRYEISEEVK